MLSYRRDGRLGRPRGRAVMAGPSAAGLDTVIAACQWSGTRASAGPRAAQNEGFLLLPVFDFFGWYFL